MLAEFTTIGTLFQSFVGDRSYPMIIVVGVLTTTYTTYGGLAISIITDQFQAIFAALLIIVITIYVSAPFLSISNPRPPPLAAVVFVLIGATASFSARTPRPTRPAATPH